MLCPKDIKEICQQALPKLTHLIFIHTSVQTTGCGFTGCLHLTLNKEPETASAKLQNRVDGRSLFCSPVTRELIFSKTELTEGRSA